MYKLTIQHAKDLAAKRGGVCLSEQYIHAKLPLRWRCHAGHIWEATWSNVSNHKSWCPACAGLAKHTIEEMQTIAMEREGVCLSVTYSGLHRHLSWRCKLGHTWKAIPKAVLKGTWCPICAGNQRCNLEEILQLATRRGGRCCSEDYVNDNTALKWTCALGHRWAASPGNVKRGRWCPDCSSALGERFTRAAFEQLFGVAFPRVRPNWLKSPRTQCCLELDGFNEGLRIAFEHQGSQHFEELKHFHRAPDEFQAQLERDTLKREICQQQGVLLVEVPEVPRRLRLKDLAAFIVSQTRRAPELDPQLVTYDGVFLPTK